MRAAVFVLLVTVIATNARSDSLPWTHIRGMSPPARRLLDIAAEHSALVRALADAIEQTDVVVMLMFSTEPANEGRRPFMRFLSAVGDTRYVVVQMYWTPQPSLAHVPSLAHELQHALELAAAPEVRDEESFSLLFGRIGWPTGRRRFETQAGRTTEALVREELQGSRLREHWATAPPLRTSGGVLP